MANSERCCGPRVSRRSYHSRSRGVRSASDLSQYLLYVSKYRLTLSADAQLKVARGPSLNLSVFAARIHDPLALPRAGASDDDVLLQQQQWPTS